MSIALSGCYPLSKDSVHSHSYNMKPLDMGEDIRLVHKELSISRLSVDTTCFLETLFIFTATLD